MVDETGYRPRVSLLGGVEIATEPGQGAGTARLSLIMQEEGFSEIERSIG